ncbi:hypothetical protein [Sinobaca sp. H24]|uniref:hypothetical protein n=1 Tax=Sinobaca sp. H24 TaxID=2923376 RepID=UPI0020798A01|nr:hypothetical protein [Sinobaca sp. H24]
MQKKQNNHPAIPTKNLFLYSALFIALFCLINVFNLFPGILTAEEANGQTIIEKGLLLTNTYQFNVEHISTSDELRLAMIQYDINTLHNVLLGYTILIPSIVLLLGEYKKLSFLNIRSKTCQKIIITISVIMITVLSIVYVRKLNEITTSINALL